MVFPAAERASMLSLDPKLSAKRAPHLKHKLREALNLLDEQDKTGSEILLELALRKHQGVVDAIGGRRPEDVVERAAKNHAPANTMTTGKTTSHCPGM